MCRELLDCSEWDYAGFRHLHMPDYVAMVGKFVREAGLWID